MSNDEALEQMKNKILLKRQALEAARDTVNFQIANLKTWYSRKQIPLPAECDRKRYGQPPGPSAPGRPTPSTAQW